MKRKMLICLFAILFFLTAMPVSFGWGIWGHKHINKAAVFALPAEMRTFFYNHVDFITEESVVPDIRKYTINDKNEFARHYIDIEDFGIPIKDFPKTMTEASSKFDSALLQKSGMLPWYIQTITDKLTKAFKNKNKTEILFLAADLGHYIADAHMPLHTSSNHDGQLTNQKGIHALWETVVPEIKISNYNLHSTHKAHYIKNKEQAVWAAIRRSHALLPDVFAKEKAVSANFTDKTKYRIEIRNGKEVKYYTTTFAKAYAAALGTTINDQLIHSADMVADFWYTAWVDAGKPDINSLPAAKLKNTQKLQLKKELKSFKQNSLIKDGYLRAKDKKKDKKSE